MRRFRIGLVLLAIVSIAYSQAPQSFNYQAVLRDNEGNVRAKESIELQIEIIQSVSAAKNDSTTSIIMVA